MLEYIIQNFQNLYYTTLYGGVVLFLMLEHLLPRIHHNEIFYVRWFNNIFLSAIGFYFSWLVTAYTADYLYSVQSFTPSFILTTINSHFISAFALLFVAMELTSYIQHRVFHHYKLLWKLHTVHHSDTEIDATTSHRHHPIEVALATVILTSLYLLLQSPPEAFVCYFMLRLVVSIFSHSNVRVPEKLDRVLRWVIITPDFHRLHHASDRKYTDSNFGTITPWLDHLFGTATKIPYASQDNLETGLGYFRAPKDSRLDNLLLLPWRKAK